MHLHIFRKLVVQENDVTSSNDIEMKTDVPN